MRKLEKMASIAIVIFLSFSILVVKSTPLEEGHNGIKTTVQNYSTSIVDKSSFVANPRFRLPLALIPTEYKLEIRPILEITPGYERFTAPGKVWITVLCAEATSSVILHSLGLQISETSVQVKNVNTGAAEPVIGISYELASDFLIISLDRPMAVNIKYEIYIEYVAPISQDRLDGMYLDSYFDAATGETRYISTTLFTANAARRAFPCFDEPGLKAIFNIAIARHNKYHALCNTNMISTSPILLKFNSQNRAWIDWHLDVFHASELMSTYLVAMIVSDLDHVDAPITYPQPEVRVFAAPYHISRGAGDYSLNLSRNVLEVLEDYYDTTYQLDKLDSVALPHFFFSATEHWGLITYAERVLLYTEGETTEEERYRVTNIVVHEIAHQWWGNDVTCKWWTYVWLNEGFATFVSHIGVDKTYPEFQPWSQFILNVYQSALRYDASIYTHPVANEPITSEAIGGIYNTIVYDKGASLLRMMESVLTEPVLRSGLQRYLKKMSRQGAVQDDLFESLQEVADETGSLNADASVKEIMDTWTTQSGFPLLRVSSLSSDELQISQEKFLDENHPSSWWIPVALQTGDGTYSGRSYPDHWIAKDQKQIVVDANTDQLIIVNPGSTGFYRILYDTALTQRIQVALENNSSKICSTARSKILDDYFHFAFSNYTTVESALSLTKYLDQETDLLVWKTVLQNLKQTHDLFRGTEHFVSFQKYMLPKLESALSVIGWEPDEKGSKVILRAELLNWACEMGLQSCQETANNILISNSSPQLNHQIPQIPVDLRQVFFCTAVALSSKSVSSNQDKRSDALWEHLNEKLNDKNTFETEKSHLMKILSCTQDSKLLSRLLALTVSENSFMHIRDKYLLIEEVGRNPKGTSLAFEFIFKDISFTSESFRDLKFIASTIFKLSSYSASQDDLAHLQDFIKENFMLFDMNDQKSLISSVKKIEENMVWKKSHGEEIRKWLDSQTL